MKLVARSRRKMVSLDQHRQRRNLGKSTAPMPENMAKDLVRLFKLLSDETRLRILYYLIQEDEFHVRALCEMLGQSQPAVSHHLALLRMAGLIQSRREGKHNFYRLLPERFQEILDLGFGTVPKKDRRVRFENYVLAYAPPVDANDGQ